ncbi:MAG TPA: hypothetical protein VM345_07790 [Acidimicrobiales bacterium]|nr:hypothetical protein [Acidimicrobiales bacterium]
MSFWDRVRAALKREKQDVDEALREFEERANRSLDARERELHGTPEEKLAIQQERAAAADEELEAIRRKIEGS